MSGHSKTPEAAMAAYESMRAAMFGGVAADHYARILKKHDAERGSQEQTMNEPTLTDAEIVQLDRAVPTTSVLLVETVERIVAARVADVVDRERAIHRDLVSRLRFGDNITEPMADNDTLVAWFEQQSRDASEWRETQLWRNDCYAAGHPQDDDCRECDPHFAVERERAAWATKIEALAGEWVDAGVVEDGVYPEYIAAAEAMCARQLRALLSADDD